MWSNDLIDWNIVVKTIIVVESILAIGHDFSNKQTKEFRINF